MSYRRKQTHCWPGEKADPLLATAAKKEGIPRVGRNEANWGTPFGADDLASATCWDILFVFVVCWGLTTWNLPDVFWPKSSILRTVGEFSLVNLLLRMVVHG